MVQQHQQGGYTSFCYNANALIFQNLKIKKIRKFPKSKMSKFYYCYNNNNNNNSRPLGRPIFDIIINITN